MRFGRIQIDNQAVLTTLLGNEWIHYSRAIEDYQRIVEERTPDFHPADIADLIRKNIFNRSYYRKIAEFVQRNRRMETYRITGTPSFLLPWRPGKIIAIGRNFRAHVAEFDHKMPDQPILFAKAPSSCIGPEDPILLPAEIGRVDHEGELGVVIKKTARQVSPEKAREYIAGYTLVNDVTARDRQRAAMKEGNPWFLAKSMDTFCPIGPVVILADALDWPVVTSLEVRVNGEIRQQSDTGRYIFDIPTLLAYITRFITLEAGDLIATGTPEGVSPLNAGDIVTVSNPEIGDLRNPVKASD